MLREVGRREEVLVVAVTTRHERASFDDRLPEEARRAFGIGPRPSAQQAAGSPTTFGICVFACSPSSGSRAVGERREQRLVAEAARERRGTSGRRSARATSASTSFMPPCSTRSMRWSCSSVIDAVDVAVHAASFVRTSSAAALPA